MTVTPKVWPHGAVYPWPHRAPLKARVLVSQYTVDAHGVVQHGRPHLGAVLVVNVTRLVVVLQRVVVHSGLGGQDGVTVWEFDGRYVETIPLAGIVHVREKVEVEVRHVRRHCVRM